MSRADEMKVNKKYKKEKPIKEKKHKKEKAIKNKDKEDIYTEIKSKKKEKRKTKIFCVFIIIILILGILGGIGYIVYYNMFQPFQTIVVKNPIDMKQYKLNILDIHSNSRPFAIMVDNNENAWPQFNINKAFVVYEMPVEWGLSRLMAIFKDQKDMKMVGPMRSARHYFLDYVKEYDAIYVHEGYSPRAIREIESRNIDSVVYTEGLWWRDNTRFAPHNAVTSSQRMLDAAKKRKYKLTTNKRIPLRYSLLPLEMENAISAVTINTGFSSYATLKLQYNDKTKKYEKSEIGEVIKDAVTKTPLAATNIIMLHVKTTPLYGYGAGKGRIDIDTTQDMSGYYFVEGQGVKITAKKKTRDSNTIYKLENGKELKMKDGNTFIFLIPNTQKINIKGIPKPTNNVENNKETKKAE